LEIEGAVALVTGGANGLGLAIAKCLHGRGARIAVLDQDESALALLPPEFDCQAIDVTDPALVGRAVANVVARLGRIDVLVNNAGVISSEPFVNLLRPSELMHGYDRFRRAIVANLDSVFIVTAAVVEQMVLSRSAGAVVNISSISANGNEGQTAYSAAKAGVNALTVTWAKELGRWGIRCNAVAPGFIESDSTRRALSDEAIRHVRSKTPLRRLGEVQEVAQAVCAVIENDFLNGVILHVDGGLTL
jgi:3-oxoacyl-[acyl-carrier protein] reductase